MTKGKAGAILLGVALILCGSPKAAAEPTWTLDFGVPLVLFEGDGIALQAGVGAVLALSSRVGLEFGVRGLTSDPLEPLLTHDHLHFWTVLTRARLFGVWSHFEAGVEVATGLGRIRRGHFPTGWSLTSKATSNVQIGASLRAFMGDLYLELGVGTLRFGHVNLIDYDSHGPARRDEPLHFGVATAAVGVRL